MTARIIKNFCYILTSFPNPSETFISDEVASLLDIDIKPYILTRRQGDISVVHPTAQKLLDLNIVSYIKKIPKFQTLTAVFKLFLKRPRTTLSCFVQALFLRDRWIYFQAVPYALTLLDKKIDYIHSHFADWNFLWARALSKWSGIPFGVTTHGYDLRDDPIPPSMAIKCFKDANIVVTVSEFNQKFMAEKYQIPVKKIKVIHCGIDIDRFRYCENYDKFLKKTLKLINVGRLVPEKGQDVLIQALAEVRKRGIKFDLTIIGDGILKDKLLELCKNLQLDNSIHFVGAKSQNKVIEMLHNSDVFILSSRNEGLPIVCMETMAAGCFMIATNINGIPELVQDGVNGLLFESEDIDGLADAICWVDQNRDSLQNMCTLAREKVESEFDRKKCTQMLLDSIEAQL